MGEFLATMNYDFLWGLCVGVTITGVGWIVLRPSSTTPTQLVAEHVPLSPDPQQLTLPFDAPSADVLPAAFLPTNVTMTIAPTIVPRVSNPTPVSVSGSSRRGRPKNSTTAKKKTTKSSKSPRRATTGRRKQSRPSVTQFFRRLITLN